MKILQISTVRHNPGDDFIRFGQQHLLRKVALRPTFRVVHKHDPRTLFEGFKRGRRTPHRLLAPLLYRAYSAAARTPNLLEESDLVAFAGTPFIWRQNARVLPSTSANAEWVRPTWHRLINELTDVPVINLAAGSSLNVHQSNDEILRDERVARFLRSAVARSAATTARDRRTAAILTALGHDVPVLACTSLWAASGVDLADAEPEYVAVNVMRRGVHGGRGKTVADRTWQRTISTVVSWLAERHNVCLVCHSQDELSVAREWFPERRSFHSYDAVEVLRSYGKALYTVSNRVHGAGGAASFGRPALGIGGDSRVELLREFGLPTLDIGTASADAIIAECERIEGNWTSMADELAKLARAQEEAYLRLLRPLRGAI